MFSILDINRHISLFLLRDDIVSLCRSSKELNSHLCHLSYKNFIFNERAGSDEIKNMMKYSNFIETLEIRNFSYVEPLIKPLKNLKTLTLVNCLGMDLYKLKREFPHVDIVIRYRGIVRDYSYLD